MGDTLEQSQAGDQEKYEHLPDNTIGTLAQLLRDIIPLTNNKVLAKDLKHFATLQISHGVGGSERGCDLIDELPQLTG